MILIHTSVKLVTKPRDMGDFSNSHFNPHEREARDEQTTDQCHISIILIHTSVKLVTGSVSYSKAADTYILIHTSVKLVT